MSSSRATIAQAAADALTAASGSDQLSGLTFAVVRKYVPASQLQNLTKLTLTVPPIGPEKRSLLSRKSIQKDFSFDIGIQKRLSQACDPEAAAGNAEIDALMLFAEQIAHFFEPDPALNQSGEIGNTGAWWQETVIDPPYDPDHLRELRVFTSTVIVTVKYV